MLFEMLSLPGGTLKGMHRWIMVSSLLGTTPEFSVIHLHFISLVDNWFFN